jgi:hypothetical protein
MQNNNMHHGGQLGASSSDATVTFTGNQVHDNNIAGFETEWEAGGLKQVRMTSPVVTNNTVYNNNGIGLWCDLDCTDATYSGNVIHHNSKPGIFYEVSNGASIHDNVAWENGWVLDDSGSLGGGRRAAIMVGNSRNTEVFNNTLAWNVAGIALKRLDRSNATWNDVYNNYIHDNTILAQDYPGGNGFSTSFHSCRRVLALAYCDDIADRLLYDPSKNNRGTLNKYYYLTPESSSSTSPRFRWNETGYALLSQFNATPAEENGRYLTQEEKDALVSAKGIPATPEH